MSANVPLRSSQASPLGHLVPTNRTHLYGYAAPLVILTSVAVILLATLTLLLARRCRFCADLSAHDEWPLDPCDPRLDELQTLVARWPE